MRLIYLLAAASQKTAEHIAKVSAALTGNQNARGATRSPETRARMRIAAKRREEAKRIAMNKQSPSD